MSHIPIKPYLLFAGALSFLAPPASAVPVQVSAACEVPGMKFHYGDTLLNILDQLRFGIVERLKRPRLAYWQFNQSSPPSQRDMPPAEDHAPVSLQFVLTEPQRRVLKVRMIYSAPGRQKTWDAVWKNPGQLKRDGYPESNAVTGELLGFISENLLNPHEEDLRSFLEVSAPLALGGFWEKNPKDLRLVLPLPWSRYSALSRSEFRIACTRSLHGTQAEVELFSNGTGNYGEYKEGTRLYKAVTVSPQAWKPFHGGSRKLIDRRTAKQLYPKLAYLHKEVNNLDVEVFKP